MKPYIAQIRSNLRLMGRDRTVLFFTTAFPLVFFFVFAQAFGASGSSGAMAQVLGSVLIIGVLGNGFFGAGMRTVQDREANVLRRFKVAPANAGPVITASLVSGLVSFLPTVFLFFFFARAIYHVAPPHNLGSLVLFISVGVLSFRAMGMIIAAVVNSAQEAQVLIQLLYLPMLFLSGATFPVSRMPLWLQTVAQFLPSTYLYQGIQSILIGGDSIASNWFAVVALALATGVAVFVGIKLFRWEKEERIENRAKLWILGVLAPFFALGFYQAHTKENIIRSKVLARSAARTRSVLFENARIFVGTGQVIPNGAILIREGKIAELFDISPSDTKRFGADVVNVAGKTLIPGLIDMHVHLGSPGGVYQDFRKYADQNATRRRLAAYLYSGVTAVRSTGDWLDGILELRKQIRSGEYSGAELFSCGPIFTAKGGHPTELLKNIPAPMRDAAEKQFVRLPESAAEAQKQVDDLKHVGVDCIKAVLESGNRGFGEFNHLDAEIYRAIAEEARRQNLPLVTHTGNVSDVKEAAAAGTNTMEHGSAVDPIPSDTFAQMKAQNIGYDPTLSVFEALHDLRTGNATMLNRPLLEQIGPRDLLAATRVLVEKNSGHGEKSLATEGLLRQAEQNLKDAYSAGVFLIAGSDAGNMLVLHGPTIQHELALWVKAGVPAEVVLQAATHNAARALHSESRIGSLEKGRDATLIVLDGDPVTDITALEHISSVMLKGERISRSELLDQEKP